MANRLTQNRRPRIPSLKPTMSNNNAPSTWRRKGNHDPKPGLGDPSRPPARRRQSKERCRSCTDPPKRDRRLSATEPVTVSGGPFERQYL